MIHVSALGVIIQTQQRFSSCKDERVKQKDRLQKFCLGCSEVINMTESKCTCSRVCGCVRSSKRARKSNIKIKQLK